MFFRKNFKVLPTILDSQPMMALVCGKGVYPTTEEIGDPDVLRMRRLTPKDLYNEILLTGIDSVAFLKRFDRALEWQPNGAGTQILPVSSAFVLPIYNLQAVATNLQLAERFLRIVLTISSENCRVHMAPDDRFDGKEHSAMHRTMTVILVSGDNTFDVRRRFVQRSQTEAVSLIKQFELACSPGSVNLSRSSEGVDQRRARAKAKAKVRSRR
jgi:hypothetical protein